MTEQLTATVWSAASMRQMVRQLTGRRAATQISDAEIDRYILEYCTTVLPLDLPLEDFEQTWSTATVASQETLELPDEVVLLRGPYFMDSLPLPVVADASRLYQEYPKAGEPYQGQPQLALYLGRTLTWRPIPDDAYTFQAQAVILPETVRWTWGRLIVYGAAMLIYSAAGELEQAEALSVPYVGQRNLIMRPLLFKLQSYRGQRRF